MPENRLQQGSHVEPEALVEGLRSRRGLPVVISAPSGTGKTTVCWQLLSEMPELSLSISVTTRPLRKDEQDGRDYYFVSQEKFQEEVRTGRLLEWAEVHGHWYGTPRTYLEEKIEAGTDIVLDIDVQGARSVKKAFCDAVLIFLLPPSLEELERRLRTRSSDSTRDIGVRLKNALAELNQYFFYDYLVVNDQIGQAVNMIKSIIIAERLRISRLCI
jgi:guanylate kinase